MSRPAPSPAEINDPDSLDGWERALLDRQLEALGRLADMGMALAAAIHDRAVAAEPASEADQTHAAMDFARVSRAVRMTFALQSRLIAEFKGAARRADAADHDDGPDAAFGRPDIVDHDVVRRRQLGGVVKRLAEDAALEGEAVERLVREAGERLEDERFFADITRRPIGEMVALICQDLGLQPNWALLADDWWATLEIKDPPLGSPYAGWNRDASARPLPFAGEGDREAVERAFGCDTC